MKWFLGRLFGGGAQAVAGAVKDVAEVFVPNAEGQAARDAADAMSARGQFAGEFREIKTWWDSLIDGLNRLPRPVLVFMAIWYLFLSFGDKDKFLDVNEGLASIPEPMWWIIGSIIGFYFSFRSGEKVHYAAAKRRMVESVAAARAEEAKTERKRLDIAAKPTDKGVAEDDGD